MTNVEVIKNFIKGVECKSSNGDLYVTKWDGSVRLINYSTCIAQKIGKRLCTTARNTALQRLKFNAM